MKKFLILIFVALIGTWAGLTWIIGSITQKGFSEQIKEFDSNMGRGAAAASIIEESYTRGFLTSEAITKISAAKQPDEEQKEFFLNFKVWHGPLMLTPEGLKLGAEYVLVTLEKNRLPLDIQRIVDEGFKGEEPVRLGIHTGFGGGVAINAEIAPFSSDHAGSNKVNFAGLTGDLKTDAKTSYVKGKLKIGALTIEDKKDGTLLTTAEANGEIDYTDMILRVTGDGSSHLDFPEIKMTAGGGDYVLKDLHFENASIQNSGKLKTTSKVSIGSFKGAETGKYAEIMAKLNGQLEAEFTAEGMDTETLQLMAEAQKKMQESRATGGADLENAKQSLHDYLIAASSLLQPGYKMKNHIEFTNKGGKSELGLGLEYAGEKPLYELASIRELLEALEIAVNLQIVKDLLPTSLAQKVQPALAMGFILDNGALFKGDAILTGGELKVNGQASPALQQMGPMLELPIPWEKLGMAKGRAAKSK
jgi:uncharacterized protein YdgA (DUF945 family)